MLAAPLTEMAVAPFEVLMTPPASLVSDRLPTATMALFGPEIVDHRSVVNGNAD
jgi:hypothetical protein